VDQDSDERVTYFEALTALAYLWFADRPVQLGIFEVGMGGRWDATNLVEGDVAVLAPIALDHPELGATVHEVAGEKAGIIKPAKVAVSREQDADALDVIVARCSEMGATLQLEFRDWELEERLTAVGGQSIRVRGLHGTYDDLFLPMFGEHAARNAAAAIVAFEALVEEPLGEEIGGPMARADGGGRPPAHDHAGRRPQPGRGRGPGRGAPRVLHVGPAPPGDLGEREQEPGGDRGRARAPDRRRLRRP